jgi:hypothetical protein
MGPHEVRRRTPDDSPERQITRAVSARERGVAALTCRPESLRLVCGPYQPLCPHHIDPYRKPSRNRRNTPPLRGSGAAGAGATEC